jgi:outer membrane protein TolC
MTRATVLFSIALLFPAARATAQTALTPISALHQAYTQRASITTNRQRLEEARRNAAAAGAYPATRLDLGHNLFNQIDIGGSPDLVLYQPIDVFGKTRALRRQGEAAVLTAQGTLRQGALDVQQEVLTAYANLLSAQRLLALARAQKDIAEAVRISTSKRVAARDLPAIQADRAALEVQRADQLVTDRLAAVEAARLRLAAALGIDKLPTEDDLAPFDRPSNPTKDPTASRPELLTLRSEAAQAVADERVARQGLVPDLEIQAGRSPFDQNPSQYNARLQLTATLWDNGATKNKIRAAEAHRKAAESALQDRLKSAQKDIAASKIELDAAEASVAGYAKLADGARSLLDRTQRGFELGANTLIDVLDARRALADAQELTINANLRRDLAIEGFLRSQGRLLEEPQ